MYPTPEESNVYRNHNTMYETTPWESNVYRIGDVVFKTTL